MTQKTMSKREKPVLSLCMPTNGVSEWVFPSLDSIYSQQEDEALFEVVVMDNGNNAEFLDKIKKYMLEHKNLRYYHTEKSGFLSEPEVYKKAKGNLIKFINHRSIMRDGSIKYFLGIEKKYRNTVGEKPIIYFTNGTVKRGKLEKRDDIKKKNNNSVTYRDFSGFMSGLGIQSTCSSGMAIWKSDMDNIPENEKYNELFPHTNILFFWRRSSWNGKERKYIIDNTVLWHDQRQGKKPKGSYNVFYAFAVEYNYILVGLLRNGDLTVPDYLSIKHELKEFVTDLYIDFIIMQKYCSYSLDRYRDWIKVFFKKDEIQRHVPYMLCKRIYHKTKLILKKENTVRKRNY